MQQMLRAKCHWGLHIGMLKPTLSIRAFGPVGVRARKPRGLYELWPIGLGRYARHALGIIPGETYREPQAASRKLDSW